MEAAKRTKTACKTRLTSVSNKLSKLTTEDGKHQFEVYIEQFKTKLQHYDEAQSAVELLSNEDELENIVSESEEWRDSKLDVLAKANGVLENLKAEISSSSSSSNCTHSHQASASPTLPRLELLRFSGDYTKWQSFWDKFTAMVHDNPQLPAVSKFSYLQTLLEGDAATAISGLALTATNYESARTLLEKRFGRKERIIFSHVQCLLNLSPSGKTVAELWTLHDTLLNHVRSLESLNIKGETYGVILTPLVLYKLPENIRLEWARLGEGKESDLESLLDFLHTEIVRRERSQTFRAPDRRPTTNRQQDRQASSSVSSLFSNSSNSSECSSCAKGGHTTEQCFKFLKLTVAERYKLALNKALCFQCLKPGHLKRHCQDTVVGECACPPQRTPHHKLLCETVTMDTKQASGRVQAAMNVSSSTSRLTMLQVATTSVLRGKVNHCLSILFDSGSDRSYISTSAKNKLGLSPVGTEEVSLALFGEGKPNKREVKNIFNLALGKELLTVIETPIICSPIHRHRLPDSVIDDLLSQNIELANGSLVDSDSQVNIDVLIGVDHFWQLMSSNVRRISDSLSVQESAFGWILSGSWIKTGKSMGCGHVNRQFLCMTDIPLDFQSRLWDLDMVGITESEENHSACDNDKVSENFKQNVKFEDGRYVVSLPWKPGMREQLQDNVSIAHKRAGSLSKKLGRDPSLARRYDEALAELESLNIIHEIPPNEISTSNEPVFYLPHRPVIREVSTSTKVRPVFDASVKDSNGLSLNDCMETGPNLIPNLPAVLLRFRRWKFGMSADITKAFLQIKVAGVDKNVHRFIWDVNGQRRFMRFDRVVFGNASSPFLLNATLKHHLEPFSESHAHVISELKQNLYVDDWLSGADHETQLVELKESATNILQKGGFPLTKWNSNSSIIEGKSTKCDLNVEVLGIKILGMLWDTTLDCFHFEAHAMNTLQFTKRLVLSFIARIYDPLGFLNPFTILIKILFQDLWLLGLQWDDPLPREHQKKMCTWVHGFQDIREWKVPRCLSLHYWAEPCKTLLCFSDASNRAFGCCIYLKVTDGNSTKVSLIASRVRVAPVKKVTLPRLELLGALLAARLLSFVIKSLNFPVDIPYTCSVDSSIVLAWIKGDPTRWKQFVRNRVTEIHTLTDPANWYHIAGKRNPADLLTRGISASELAKSNEWLKGPSLSDTENFTEPEAPSDELLLSEMVKQNSVLVAVNASPPFPLERFSSFHLAIKVLSWVLRFVNNLKTAVRKNISVKENTKSENISSEEMRVAEHCIFKMTQREYYGEEVEMLLSGKTLKRGSPLFKFSPFLDNDGLMRVGGRLQMSDVSFDAKHPIILPKCYLGLLMVRSKHEFLKHAGVSTIITSLRDRFWIIGARPLAKKVCKYCIHCQKQDSRPGKQPMAPLPSDRIRKTHAFDVVGLDHCGPIYCKDTSNKKHYILLFTCAQVRAVHLELVPSLNLIDFVLAFRRFCARRGLPSIIYSDNAKTFNASSNLIKQFGPSAPVWKFSIPLAPWYGGWWERLVRSTKAGLRKTLGKALLDRSVLETVLFEVEASINSRPLTYVEEDSNPLTPSHFLLGRSSHLSTAHTTFIPKSGKDFLLMHQEHTAALSKFWTTWSEDYIKNLPPIGNVKGKMDLEEGSIVLIREEGMPRLKWPMAKVIKLIPSKDQLFRAAKLKTEKGELTRSIQKLHKLEVSDIFTSVNNSELIDTPIPISGTGQIPPKSTSTSAEVQPHSPISVAQISPRNTSSAEVVGSHIPTSGADQIAPINTNQPKTAVSRFGRTIKPPSVLDL